MFTGPDSLLSVKFPRPIKRDETALNQFHFAFNFLIKQSFYSANFTR